MLIKTDPFYVLFLIPSYLTQCLGLKEEKETLSKMYDSMRRE